MTASSRTTPGAAVELDEQFERKAAQLVTRPMIGRGGRVENTRDLVVRPNYLLIYDIEGDTVRILACFMPRSGGRPKGNR